MERDHVPDRSAPRGRRARLRGAAARGLPALSAPAFRTYWLGILVADGSTAMFQLTAAWLVYELTAPPLSVAFMLGVLGFCRTVPLLAFVLAGGVMADRFGRRRILMLTNSASATCVAAFGMLVLVGWVTVWLVLIVALLMGCAMAFNRPAHQAFIRDLVPVESLQNAVALMALMQKVLRIGVPLLAGVLLAAGSAALPLLLARAPEHLRGRVMSVFTLADIGVTPLGSLIVGVLATSGTVVVTAVVGVAARFPRLRRS